MSHRARFWGVWPFPGNHHHPQPLKMSTSASFREVDLSLATTTTHNPWEWARRLIFGGVWPLPGNHHLHNPRKWAVTLVFGGMLSSLSLSSLLSLFFFSFLSPYPSSFHIRYFVFYLIWWCTIPLCVTNASHARHPCDTLINLRHGDHSSQHNLSTYIRL